MALPKDLKSNMTGMPAFEPENEEVVFPASDADETALADPAIPVDPETPTTPENMEDILKRVEDQLARINQILSLKQSPAQDLTDVNAALDRIEQQIVSISSPSRDINLSELEKMLSTVVEKLDRNERHLTQDLRENATFRIQVRQGMQHDLDVLKDQLSGEQFNPILREIATVYSEYQVLLEEDIPPRARKNLMALFEQLEDILDDYGAEVIRSEVGTVRKTRSCKIINKIMTGDSELHNTIVVSRKPGVMRGQVVLYQELVDVYVFDPSLSVPRSNNTNEDFLTEETPATETPTEE